MQVFGFDTFIVLAIVQQPDCLFLLGCLLEAITRWMGYVPAKASQHVETKAFYFFWLNFILHHFSIFTFLSFIIFFTAFLLSDQLTQSSSRTCLYLFSNLTFIFMLSEYKPNLTRNGFRVVPCIDCLHASYIIIACLFYTIQQGHHENISVKNINTLQNKSET